MRNTMMVHAELTMRGVINIPGFNMTLAPLLDVVAVPDTVRVIG